ncbi:MAG: hypothetical protein DLM66_11785 [Candidatus Dormiibacter spiritus]|nr:MAG: hypothetical protein DLM66_11785 [Candidatus Dormibacteraeota bacterium]
MSALSRREFLKYTGVAAGVAALDPLVLACSNGSSAASKAGGTLVISLPTESDIFDPHATGGWDTYKHTLQMFEGLTKENLTDANEKVPSIQPALAEKWDLSEDKTTYTFHLRQGVKFHDGTDFNADAAVFNIRRIWDKTFESYYARANAFSGQYFVYLKDIQKVDDHTVKMTLKQPFSDFLRMQNQSYGEPLMISPTQVKKLGNEGFAANPIGTGRFKFMERTAGAHATMLRSDSYWGSDKALVEKLIFVWVSDAQAALAGLKSGQAHLKLWVPPDDVDPIKSGGFNVSMNKGPIVNYWYLNTRHPILKDKKVRQAINLSIDRDSLVRNISKGTNTPATGLIPPGCNAFDSSFKGWAYDPTKAKALLADAGYPNGFSVKFMIPEYGGYQDTFNARMQQDWKKVGINIDYQKLEWVTYMHKWAEGLAPDVGALQLGWGMSADYWFQLVANGNNMPPNGTNSGWYQNRDVDALLDKAAKEFDDAKRRDLYQKAHQIVIMEDAAFAPYTFDLAPIALTSKVKGFVNPPEDWFQLWTVSLSG